MLSVENVFFIPSKLKEKAERVRQRFVSVDGDFGMLLNVYRQYKVHSNIMIELLMLLMQCIVGGERG